MHPLVQIIDILHLPTPSGVFMYLIDEKILTPHLRKVIGHFCQCVGREVVGISRAIQHMAVISTKVLLDVLLHQSRFADSLGALDHD